MKQLWFLWYHMLVSIFFTPNILMSSCCFFLYQVLSLASSLSPSPYIPLPLGIRFTPAIASQTDSGLWLWRPGDCIWPPPPPRPGLSACHLTGSDICLLQLLQSWLQACPEFGLPMTYPRSRIWLPCFQWYVMFLFWVWPIPVSWSLCKKEG